MRPALCMRLTLAASPVSSTVQLPAGEEAAQMQPASCSAEAAWHLTGNCLSIFGIRECLRTWKCKLT